METILLHGLGQTADSFSLTARWMGMGGRKAGGARCPALGSLMQGEAAYPALYLGSPITARGLRGRWRWRGSPSGGFWRWTIPSKTPGGWGRSS